MSEINQWEALGKYLDYGYRQGKKITASKKKQRKASRSQGKARRNNR